MKNIMVVVANSNHAKVEAYKFINEEEAKNYIKDRYVKEIQKPTICDYDNTYIDKNFRHAKVSAGIYSVSISLCSNVKYYNAKNRNSSYRKRRRNKRI